MVVGAFATLVGLAAGGFAAGRLTTFRLARGLAAGGVLRPLAGRGAFLPAVLLRWVLRVLDLAMRSRMDCAWRATIPLPTRPAGRGRKSGGSRHRFI